jgi:hypothetical protein
MGLQVIGAGISRTGTESLKKALEHLGFGKCYHMYELMTNPGHLVHWKEMMETGTTDLEVLFTGYQSAVDLPACSYYQRLMSEYPQAKVILSVRDPDQWYESASMTIFLRLPRPFIKLLSYIGRLSPKIRWFVQYSYYIDEFMDARFFQGKAKNPGACKELFNQWNRMVVESVPAQKLLVYNISEGWEPLCRYLEVPVPGIPFPAGNSRGEYFNVLNKFFPFLINSGKLLKEKWYGRNKSI